MAIIHSVEKSLSLLEFLTVMDRPIPLQEASKVSGLPKPTAYRLLNSLQELGYISRPQGSRDYALGPRILKLQGVDPHRPLKRAVHPFLEYLHSMLNETVNLGIISGTKILYLGFLQTTRPLRFIAAPDLDDPYYCTALGRAIASALSKNQQELLLKKTVFRPRTKQTIASLKEMEKILQTAKKNGYAEEINENIEGGACLAFSLSFLGFPEAAISVSLPTQRLTSLRKKEIVTLFHELRINPKVIQKKNRNKI